jgi:lipoprotein-anchoring transpeptidase ErfK/SrfK
MKHFLLLSLCALLSLPVFARAGGAASPADEAYAEESYAAPADLDEALSPEELEAELAQDPDAEYAPPAAALAPRLVVVVDKSEQKLYVYEDGQLTGSWLVSTGTETRRCAPTGRCYKATTPVGSFRPYRMHHKYTSRLWEARMDRAIFIVGGIALHATYGDNVSKLGTKQSGGCIRQAPENADRLFRLVKQYGMGNTLVKVQR